MNPTHPSEVQAWCRDRGFHPNRTLGQNFLIDGNILDAIVDAAAPRPGEGVLEIGPGLGVLTEALLARGARVTAVEKDARLAAWLRESLGARDAFTLIEADVLDVDLDALLAAGNQAPAGPAPAFSACVSNLPYSVGTRILLDLCRHALAPPLLVVTVQREVAERLAAPPGVTARGQAGVWVQRRYDVSLLRTIKPTCFWPRPDISSTLVRLDRHARFPLAPAQARIFDALTRHAFMHRRKQFGAAMRLLPRELAVPPEALSGVLARGGVDPRSRAEELTLEQWCALSVAWPVGASG